MLSPSAEFQEAILDLHDRVLDLETAARVAAKCHQATPFFRIFKKMRINRQRAALRELYSVALDEFRSLEKSEPKAALSAAQCEYIEMSLRQGVMAVISHSLEKIAELLGEQSQKSALLSRHSA